MYVKNNIPSPRAVYFAAHSWRDLADDELRHYLRIYQRDITSATEGSEHRAFVAMLVAGAEQELARRTRAAALGVPFDADRFPESWIADLKARTMLDRLFEYEFGAKFGRVNAAGWRGGDCPICGHHGCFRVYVADEREQRYLCYSCKAGGDAINAIRQAWDYTFHQAIEKLATDAGMPLPKRPSSDPRLADLPGRRAE